MSLIKYRRFKHSNNTLIEIKPNNKNPQSICILSLNNQRMINIST